MLNKELIAGLEKEIKNMMKQKDHILDSYENCKNIWIKKNYNKEELIQIDWFAMRFARASDILLRKIFRWFYELEKWWSFSLIDIANYTKSNGLISENFEEIRELRNFISHDYSETKLNNYLDKFIKFTPDLVWVIDKTKNYFEQLKKKI